MVKHLCILIFFRSSLYSLYSCKRHSVNVTLAGKLNEIIYLMYTNTFVECHTYVNLGQTQRKIEETNDGRRSNN